ncbi:MAG: hypothetical protein S4CHLAM123_10160 [Chlamydiales bacterium]|nr:hypothetical protein [Chlamydiales bacterium]
MTETHCDTPNLSQNAPLKPLSAEAKSLVPESIYEHYKGKRYKLLSVGRHSETLEESVIYQALYGEYGIWIRPLAMFLENVFVDGKTRPRFELIVD